MSARDAELSKTDLPGLFAGSARWIVAIVLVMGPLLQAIEFLLGNEAADNAARAAFWSAFPARGGYSMASGMLAVPFLLGGIAVLVTLTRTHSRRLAWFGGAFLTFAMVGLATGHGYEMAAFGRSLAGDTVGATSILNAENIGLPGLVFFLMFLGGAVLGTLTLAVAMWRSPYVPRIVVLFTLAFAVLDFIVGQGLISHLVNLVGFLILAVAVLRGYSHLSSRAITPAAQPGL